jgi:GNAT superfamily N-acetyltransferase
VTLEDAVAGHAVGTGPRIDQLMIDERFHRRGLGTLLLARLEERLFREHPALELESFRGDDRANAFYC